MAKEKPINVDMTNAIELGPLDPKIMYLFAVSKWTYGKTEVCVEFLAKTRATKLFVTDQMTILINKAIDLMGSQGYAREGHIEKRWRDSKIISLWMGGRGLAKLDIARWFYDCKTF